VLRPLLVDQPAAKVPANPLSTITVGCSLDKVRRWTPSLNLATRLSDTQRAPWLFLPSLLGEDALNQRAQIFQGRVRPERALER
jgi:hypothetical protein